MAAALSVPDGGPDIDCLPHGLDDAFVDGLRHNWCWGGCWRIVNLSWDRSSRDICSGVDDSGGWLNVVAVSLGVTLDEDVEACRPLWGIAASVLPDPDKCVAAWLDVGRTILKLANASTLDIQFQSLTA